MTTQYKLLPQKPTISMLNNTGFKNLPIWVREQIYKEMYQAAPEAEQEPVTYLVSNPSGRIVVESKRQAEKLASEYGDGTYTPLYTHPQPKRERLSREEKLKIINDAFSDIGSYEMSIINAVEKAHGIGEE
jgi:hypothetical protein